MARTFYIGTTGSDANPGTADQPFASAAAANALVQPGDTVYFLEGTYRNPTYGAVDAGGNRVIWKEAGDTVLKLNNVQGTAGAPITYAAAPGAAVKLQYDGDSAIVLRGSSHIRIEGFEIEGPAASLTLEETRAAQWSYRVETGTDISGNPVYDYRERDPAATLTTSVKAEGGEKPELFNAAAISLPNGSHHIEIVNNNIHHAAAHAVSAHGGNDYVTVIGNTISDCTHLTSNGTHAVSFKALDSLDANDAVKIRVEGNTFTDNYNLLVSWSELKTQPVTMAIDEGKPIHVQNSLSTIDSETGNVWDHGEVLIANNLIVRAGNAGVTVNEARGVTIAHNTIAGAGYVNELIAGDSDPASVYHGFFSAQGLDPGFRVSAGGIRVSGADDVAIVNNLISVADPSLFAIDAAADVTSANTVTSGNIFSGGAGLRVRSADAVVQSGFKAEADPGFAGAAQGDYTLSASSWARDAGSAAVANLVGTDLNNTARTDGKADVGAFEYVSVPGSEPVLHTIQSTGNSANRVDMIFLGDGYTAADISSGTYQNHVDGYLDYIFTANALTDPFSTYRSFFNIHVIDVVSNQSGADDPNAGTYVDTALGASYAFGGGPDRLLYVNTTLANAALNTAVLGTAIGSEMLYVTINAAKYGGGGGRYGVYAGGNSAAHEVALHEIGHSFAHLADEYGDYDSTKTTVYSGTEPNQPNVTADSTGAKWADWLGYVDPLLGTVGAYESGMYVDQGIFRPTLNSKMKALGQPFDPIAREAFIHEFYKYVDPLDGYDDNATTRTNLHALAVDTIDPAMIDVDWTVNGTTYANAGETLLLEGDAYGWGTFSITARAYDPTEWVRGDRSDLEQSVTWTVVNDYRLVGTANLDTLNGTENAQAILGLAGNDRIVGLGGDDDLQGGDGNDMLTGGTGADKLDGGLGFDALRYDSSASAVTIDLKLLAASGGDAAGDTISNFEIAYGSTAFGDTLTGDDGFNILYGQGGADSISGGGGNDILFGGAGADILDGGSGLNTLRYDTSGAAVSVNLSTGAASGGDAEGDTIANFAAVYGSRDFNDMLTGTNVANVLFGLGGNDTLAGLGGNDVLFGGAGADNLDGGLGFDTVRYDSSSAALTINLATNTVVGGEGQGDSISNFENAFGSKGYADTLIGNSAANILSGLGGIDTLRGEGGNDIVFGGAGADLLDGGAGFDTLRYDQSSAAVSVNLTGSIAAGGDATGDTISGFEGAYGSAYDDNLSGNDAVNLLFGLAGNDFLAGRGGDDIVTGGSGNDIFDFDTPLTSHLATNVDTIVDFNAAGDIFRLDRSVFTAFKSSGALAPTAFWAGAAAHDSDDRIIYDRTSGSLSYDADGLGGVAAVKFAVLANKAAITAADFEIV